MISDHQTHRQIFDRQSHIFTSDDNSTTIAIRKVQTFTNFTTLLGTKHQPNTRPHNKVEL
jgi:hypothetical protein